MLSADDATDPPALRWPPHCPQLRMPQRQHDTVTAADQEAAASAVVGRLLPTEAAATFVFRVKEAHHSGRANKSHGGFTVARRSNSIVVTGSSGVDLAAGVYWFLKHRSVSMCQRQLCGSTLALPSHTRRSADGGSASTGCNS